MPRVKFSKAGRWADQLGSPGHPAREPFEVEVDEETEVSSVLAAAVVKAGHGEIVTEKPKPKAKSKSEAKRHKVQTESKDEDEKSDDVLE